MRHLLQFATSTALTLLIFLCLLWESVLSPIRPGGSFLMLKSLPLLLPLFGILRGKLYTYQWAPLLVAIYFCEGIVRAWADHGLSRALAIGELSLSALFITAASWYARVYLRALG